MVLNRHHADIQPIYDAIPNYWQVCNSEEIARKHRFHYFIHSLVTRFLDMIER